MERSRRDLVAKASLGAGIVCLALVITAAPAESEEIRPGVYRTPDDRFENLPGFDFAPNYLEIGKAGALIMPQRVPVFADDPANDANGKAWEVFERWQKPFLTAFGDSDPVSRGGERQFQRRVPGAQGQPHVTVEGAGHFIQESHGGELARIINEFIAANP